MRRVDRAVDRLTRTTPFWALVGCMVLLALLSAVWIRYGSNNATTLVVAPIVLVLALASSGVRVIFLVVGGMLVLGSASTDVGTPKIAYSALVVACTVIAAARLGRAAPEWVRIFRPLVWFGLAFLVILAIGVLVGGGGSLQTVGRQAIFYILIPAAPLIGLDAGRDVHPDAVKVILLVIGIVAAVGYGADWLDRRGVSNLGFGRFVLSSLILPGFAFAFAFVSLLYERGLLAKVPWLLAIVIIPASMLITGTRTNLIIFLSIFAMLGRRRSMRIPPLHALVMLILASLLLAAVFPLVASAVVSRPDFISSRISLLLNVVNGDAVADGSFQGRSEQYAQVVRAIMAQPVFGLGLGVETDFVDTPLITVLRIGTAGTAAALAFLVATAVLVARATARFGHSRATTAFWGFALVFLAAIPFGTPFEDRGFGFTLLLAFLALGSAFGHRRRGDAPSAQPLLPGTVMRTRSALHNR